MSGGTNSAYFVPGSLLTRLDTELLKQPNNQIRQVFNHTMHWLETHHLHFVCYSQFIHMMTLETHSHLINGKAHTKDPYKLTNNSNLHLIV